MPEELFDRVQQIRQWRARVVKPGRPSEEYLLRKLLYCQRCGARMHGTRGSKAGIRRYQCSTRRYGGDCQQTIVKAAPLENQLVDWLRGFQPDATLRGLVLDAISQHPQLHDSSDSERRTQLLAQLPRLQDLYLMGDLTKSQYSMRRQVIQDELERMNPQSTRNSTKPKRCFATSHASGTPNPPPPNAANS